MRLMDGCFKAYVNAIRCVQKLLPHLNHGLHQMVLKWSLLDFLEAVVVAAATAAPVVEAEAADTWCLKC